MTARRTCLLAAYWLAVLTTAATFATAGVVCIAGNACSPAHRKGGTRG